MANGSNRRTRVSQKRREVDEQMRQRAQQNEIPTDPSVAPSAIEIPALDPAYAVPSGMASAISSFAPERTQRERAIPSREDIIAASEIPTLERQADMLERNASRNEQRRAERDRQEDIPVTAETTKVPMKRFSDVTGPNITEGSIRDTRGLTDAAVSEIEDLERRQEKLRGYGGIQNERRANALQNKINEIQAQGHSSGEDYLVPRDQYDSLMANPELSSDIDKLTQIIYNPRQAAGAAAVEAEAQKLTDGSSADFIAGLSEKYGLSEDELRDMALTRHSDQRKGYVADFGQKMEELGEKHRTLGSYASLAASLGNAVEGGYNTIAGLVTDDNRRLSNGFNTTKHGLREGVKETIRPELLKQGYDLMMGLGDLGVGVATGNAPLLLAGNTANEATLSAADRGQSARKAATYGGLSGIADYYFNKVGLDKARSIAFDGIESVGKKALIERLGIASGTEALENVLQDMTQSFLDETINGNNSALRTAYAEKIADGMTPDEALRLTAGDYAKQLLGSGLMGAVMGGAMYGGTSLANYAKGGMLMKALDESGERTRKNVEAWRQAQAEAQAANEVPDVRENQRLLDEMMAQNDVDVNAKIDNVNNAVEEINNLAEQIPEVPEENLAPEVDNESGMADAPATVHNENMMNEGNELTPVISDEDAIRQIGELIKDPNFMPITFVANDGEHILHRSTRPGEKWQLSNLDEHGLPLGHSLYETDEDLLKALKRGNHFQYLNTSGHFIDSAHSTIGELLENPDAYTRRDFETALRQWDRNANPKDYDLEDIIYGLTEAVEEDPSFADFDIRRPYWREAMRQELLNANPLAKEFYDTLERVYHKDTYELETLFRQISKDIESGEDLTRYIDRLNAALDDSPSSEVDDRIENLIGELEDYNANRAPAEMPVETTEPLPGNPNNPNVPPQNPVSDSFGGDPNDKGLRRSITNTAIKAGIVSPDDLANNPVIREIAEYSKHNNDTIFGQAMQEVSDNPDMYLEQYSSGTKDIDTDLDLDRGMILLEDERISPWKFNSIIRNIAEHGTKAGQFIQAFKKWANTGVGALAKATKVDVDATNKWKTRNKKVVESNNRIAKAISLIGKPDTQIERVPLTHDQLKEQIVKVINDAFGEESSKFSGDDIEYLTVLAETKKIPVKTITRELEHKLETGEWFTIDESLPEKAERAIKNGTISNMLDRVVNGEVPRADKEPEAYGDFLKKIRNSLQDEKIGLGDEFNDTDVYFVGKMLQEGVSKKTIEDELRHRIETGEWYTIDESLEAPKPSNQKLQNAFKTLRGDVDRTVSEPKTFEQIKDEVRNTLEKEDVLDRFEDADVDYLANLIQQGASTKEIVDALHTKSATGRWGISEETQRTVNELFEYARQFDEDSQEFVEAQAEAYRLLAEEVAPKASALEKFDTWRYMAMLGNPKTMLRNWVGNKMFSAVTGMSNNLSALIEKGVDRAYYKKTGEHIQRTKAILNPLEDKSLIDAAKLDARNKEYRHVTGSKYEKMDQDSLKRNRSVFNSGVMRLAEKAVDQGISDTSAVINKYGTSLAGYMKANGLGIEDLDASYKYDELVRLSRTRDLTDTEFSEMVQLKEVADRMEKAREYALKQADYATFHEDNAIAEFLSETSNRARNSKHGAVRALGNMFEGVLPFKKTPANILKSGFQYSPFGAIESVAKTGKLVIENTGKNKGNLEDEYTITGPLSGREYDMQKTLAADVIDSWSKTLTGSALAALGYYLFNKGVLTSTNKGEKYQDQLEGKGNYAININGHTYTLDWAAPGVMPMLVGAEINKVLKANGQLDEAWYKNPDQWIQTANALLDPMIETSMLQGLRDTIQTAANATRFDEDSTLGGILGSMALQAGLGYFTQAIPTLSGQIARTVDPIRRTTDTKSEGFVGMLEQQGRKIANKIPFLSMINTPYVDAYGRQQTNGPYDYNLEEDGLIPTLQHIRDNARYQMFSPGYYSEIETTPGDEKGREIFNGLDESGKPIKDSKVFADWRSTKKINGEKLSPDEMVTFRTEMGNANRELRNALAENEWFNSLPATKQNEIFKSLNTISDKIGQYSVRPDSVSVSDELETYLEAGGGQDGINAVVQSIQNKNLVEDAGFTQSSNIGQAYRDAYNSGDIETANHIKEVGNALAEYNLSPAAQMAYVDRAETAIPGITPEMYGTIFQTIDGNGDKEADGEITQGEIAAALPSLVEQTIGADASDEQKQEAAMKLYEAFYTKYEENSKIPQLQEDGSFKMVNRPKDETQTETESSGQGFRQDVMPTSEPEPQAESDSEYNWGSYGMPDNEYTTKSYERAMSYIPQLEPQEYATTFKAINSNPNTSLSQDEIIAYLNKIGASEADGTLIWKAYLSNPTDKTIPYLTDDGVWKTKRK